MNELTKVVAETETEAMIEKNEDRNVNGATHFSCFLFLHYLATSIPKALEVAVSKSDKTSAVIITDYGRKRLSCWIANQTSILAAVETLLEVEEEFIFLRHWAYDVFPM